MNKNKLTALFMTFSMMFMLVAYNDRTGQVNHDIDRFINAETCERMRVAYNAACKTKGQVKKSYCAPDIDILTVACISAKDYIRPARTNPKSPF